MDSKEFKKRVDSVIRRAEEASKRFRGALESERREWWLWFLGGLKEIVEKEEEENERLRSNPYTAGASLGSTAIGLLLGLAGKDKPANFFFYFANKIAEGKSLAIAVSPTEGIEMLEEFEIVEIPPGEKMERSDQKGRILLTPAEFKSKAEQMKISIQFFPPPLPIEVKELSFKKLEVAQKEAIRERIARFKPISTSSKA